jgi:hypothetical protein
MEQSHHTLKLYEEHASLFEEYFKAGKAQKTSALEMLEQSFHNLQGESQFLNTQGEMLQDSERKLSKLEC